MNDFDNNIERISQIPFFYDVSADTIRILSEFLSMRQLEKGRYVFKEGDAPDAIYFIVKGGVKVVKKNDNSGEDLLREISAMGMVGETAFIERGRRQAGVVTLEAFEAYKISVEDWEVLQKKHPQIAIEIIRKIAVIQNFKLRNATNNQEGIV